MGFSVSIANNIRANASAEYQARIPVATQENFLSVGIALEKYDLLYNEFFPALFNKIGKTYIESLLFKNKLAKYKSGTILSQQDVEEIFVEMMSAEGAYDKTGPNPLGRRSGPEVKTAYHRMNRQDYYAQSIGDIDVIRVFRSEGTMDAFITARFNAMYSGAEYDEWVAMKNLLATYDGYHIQEVPTITNESTARDFLRTIRKLSQDLTFVSDKYNKSGVKTKTDVSKQVLFINKDVLAHVDVDVLAKSFNMGKTDIQVTIEVMDDFGNLANTYGLLVDEDILKVWDTLSKMEPQRNAQGLFTNYFYHVHQILSMSPFKNAIRLVFGGAPVLSVKAERDPEDFTYYTENESEVFAKISEYNNLRVTVNGVDYGVVDVKDSGANIDGSFTILTETMGFEIEGADDSATINFYEV